MITKEMVDRINMLARKQKDGTLTPEEKEEQHSLRQQYLKAIRTQVVDALETAGYKPRDKQPEVCGCGYTPRDKDAEDSGCGCKPVDKHPKDCGCDCHTTKILH